MRIRKWMILLTAILNVMSNLIRLNHKDDDFTAKDAFFLGCAMGFGYEEGLRERKRRKRKRFSDDDID